MANIQYSSRNNTCASVNNAFISIDQINFDTDQIKSFSSYMIQWSGDNLLPSQISSDHRSIHNLSSGLYCFHLLSLVDSSIIGPYHISISSPEPIIFKQVDYSSSSCNTNDGFINIRISGGTPPYLFNIGTQQIQSSDNFVTASGLNASIYKLSVIDSNGCSKSWDSDIVINNASMKIQPSEIIPPTIFDGYGSIKLVINNGGDGPLNFQFINQQTDDKINIGPQSSEQYLINKKQNTYYYKISDKITPGSYILNVTNLNGCVGSTLFTLPNIHPLVVNCSVLKSNQNIQYSQHLTKPVFDTILIPFTHIKNNTNLWNFIKTLQLKNHITIKINNNNVKYLVVRNILDKYVLDENKIEILRLGPDPSSWFFYFYIAPGIDLIDNPGALSYSYKLIDSDSNEYDLTIGLSNNELDTQNPSLIKGSFLLDGVGYNQFASGDSNNLCISGSLTESFDDYEFLVSGVTKQTLHNTYAAGYTTAINFLDQYNILNIYVGLSDTSCDLSSAELSLISNINNIIKNINNLNYIANTYIYNSNTSPYFGKINLNILGHKSFILENQEFVDNTYDITYYYFNDKSTSLQTFYKNNQIYKDTLLNQIPDGYIIVKISDIFNNKPKIIKYNNLSINYDDHYIAAKSLIERINNSISLQFHYGDLLLYIGNDSISLNIPHNIIDKEVCAPPTPPNPTIKLTSLRPDSSSLKINLFQNIKCYIYGPKNYKHSFDSSTVIENLLSGVYIIKGDDDQLKQSLLYQQEYRLILENNSTQSININFLSYKDKLFIRNA